MPIGGGLGCPAGNEQRKQWIASLAGRMSLPEARIADLLARYGSRSETYARDAARDTGTASAPARAAAGNTDAGTGNAGAGADTADITASASAVVAQAATSNVDRNAATANTNAGASAAVAQAAAAGAAAETPLKNLPDYSVGEIRRIAAEEYVEHLDDLVCRRSIIALLGRATEPALTELAQVAGEVLNWDSDRQAAEVARALNELRMPS
jgi:glycerol-3-phosphate dehydrogenase